MSLPETKLSILKKRVAAGQWGAAVRLAAQFPNLGKHKERITRGYNARLRPSFYSELGMDPDALFEDACAAIKERYSL